MRRRLVTTLAAFVLCTACTASRSGRSANAPTPVASRPAVLASARGLASFYGPGFQQRLAASGVPFDMHALVAAHPTYPFGTIVRVRNLRNDRRVDVKIIDRGPARAQRADGVIIDLSQGAASAIGMIRDGRVPVRVDVLRWGNN